MTEQQQSAGHAPASETPRDERFDRMTTLNTQAIASLEKARRMLSAELDAGSFGHPDTMRHAQNIVQCVVEDIDTALMFDADHTLYGKPVQPASETGQASAWQPIESAPKDGTPILGCRSTWTHPYVFCYLNGPGLIEGWHDFNVSPDGRRPHDLTHWMPLPLAPSEDETTRTER